MSKHTTHTTDKSDHSHAIAEHTHALLDATAEVADQKVVEVRNRLNAALLAARETYASVQEEAIRRAKAADKAIRANPYRTAGIAFGVGAFVGFLLTRRSRNDND